MFKVRTIAGLPHNIYSNIRYYSNIKLYDEYKNITSDILNKLVVNQGVSITQHILDKLITIPSVKFDLPITDQTIPGLVGLIGTPKTRGLKAGVYIFTHKATGRKYVGSSNSLSRRLDQYFNFKHFNQDGSGQLIPFIKKEGFNMFSLEITVMPSEFSSGYYFLFLEQYYLLHKSFDLNTQRIVNFRVNQGNNVYLYDLNGRTLYYSSKSLNQIQGDLGIHPGTVKSCLKGNNYLNFFNITDTLIEGAIPANLSIAELASLISDKKALFLSNTSRTRFSKPIVLKEVETEKILKFSSIIDIVNHFKTMNITMDRNKITKIVNTDEVYKGYLFKK
uniref:GIY-YIG endonuclease n=1 Tax=Monilinia fructicola TaxID=38448 RepID=A0A889XPH3_MONFR|nr:GIY-YIG endonuclease [Monilinia fructicola]QRF72236.1 GIY-YIG endonuclease [Monilinia fructicola]QYB19428.1 GIY-YIG endonuclease [Monilinia fructicola]QYB19489.1 GIY-YIG endonuclease [Monilinia fructicola]QYB19551.1 GIY-YIG endonuclease [Monilinia fructicola]QYB19613.1 GIY-YIG endonuclease [Monilinia fructicola]